MASAGSNLLINNEGQLKLADFGLARPFDDTGRQLTNRVITLWYRPPELLLGSQNYGPAVDMWSVGCIFAELLTRKPILPGRNEFEQIDLIFKTFGTPTEQTWPGLTKLHYYQMVVAQCGSKPYPDRFSEKFGMCVLPPLPSEPSSPGDCARAGNRGPALRGARLDKRAQELLKSLLAMDPSKRTTAKAALDHDYFWEAPFPSKPEELPKYPQSHEFTAKKRRQDAAKQAGAGQSQPQPAQPHPVSQGGGYPPYPNAHHQRTTHAAPPGTQPPPYNKRPRDSYENGGYALATRRGG